MSSATRPANAAARPAVHSSVGMRVRQKDGRPRVTGEAKYYADYKFENLLHAAILHSPYPKAAIVALDVSEAEKCPGVRLVMTHKNYPTVFRDTLYYVGDLVAAVIADSLELARAALAKIKVEYERKPFVLDMLKAADPASPQVFDGKENLYDWPYHNKLTDRDPQTGLHKNKEPHTHYEFGDVEKGFAEADVIVEQRDIRYAYCKGPVMETRGCTVDHDGVKLIVYTHSQGLHDEKMRLAQALGIPGSSLNYVSPFTGSSFGAKTPAPLDINNPAHHLLIAGFACLKLRRPVRCVYTREEEMLCSWSRGSLSHVKIGFKKDGTLTTMDYDHTQELGVGGDIYPAKNSMLATGAVLYSRNCRNNRGKIKHVNTNRFTSVGWQGYGAPEGHFAVETTVDIAAEELGIPYKKVGLVCRDTDSTPFSTLLANSSGTWIQGWATYEAALDAKRRLLALAADLMRVPAEELALGDGVIFNMGNPENSIPVKDAFGVSGHYGGRHEIIGNYVNNSPHPNCLKDNDPSRLYIPKEKGAQFVSLDVDTETGMIENVVITMAQNVGRALNPKVVAGQMLTSRHGFENAVLGNDCVVDKRNGWLMTPNMIDYRPSTMLDCKVEPNIVEIPGDPTHPFGATACGEGGACASMAAFANAIYNAIGVRVKETPFTPEAILRALDKIKRKK